MIARFIQRCSDTSDPAYADYIKSRGFEVDDLKDFKLGFYRWSFADGKNLKIARVFDKSILLPCYDDVPIPVGFELRTTVGKGHYKQHDHGGRYHFFGMTERALDAIFTTEEVFLTEGTFDTAAFSLWKPNVLSLMTNKITEQHLLFLKRYVKRMYLCFDVDKWGAIQQEKEMTSLGLLASKFVYLKVTDTYVVDGKPKRAKDANDLLKGLGKSKFIKTLNTRFNDSF